jgi:CRP-like cAMP-binding protein
MSRAFIELLSAELAELRSQIAILNRRSAIEKLAALLRDLWRRTGRRGEKLQLELSRTDMADFLGLTIETVSRNLTKLRKRRIIDLPQTHTLVILDMERLERLAAGDCEGW